MVFLGGFRTIKVTDVLGDRMELDRRRVLVGYFLTLVGLLFAFVVADIIPTPAPPVCSTATCNAAYASAWVGLFLVMVGMTVLAVALFRSAPRAAPPAEGYSPGQYSFSLPSSTARTPPGSPPSPGPPGPAAPLRSCPGCGAPITSDYGFCPRCGRTLSQ
jgi:hypothetical protein